jgi:hypothetical protein
MHGLVSLTRAAELLTEAGDVVERSTLSRYIAKHADALNPARQGRETVINFEALAQHRKENIRLAVAPSTKPYAQVRARSDEAAANLRAQRRLRELELGRQEGLLILKSDAEEAAHSAVSALRSALALALNDTADVIASVTGSEVRLVRPHLRAFEKKGLDQFVRVLADYDLLGENPDAPPPQG